MSIIEQEKIKFKKRLFTILSLAFAMLLAVVFISVNAFLVSQQKQALAQRTIDSQKVLTQKTQIISGKQTSWIKVVPVSEITKDKNLISLPKSANNIKITKKSTWFHHGSRMA